MSEYTILCEILRGVQKKRRDVQEEARETENLSKLMNLDGEKKTPEMSILQETALSSLHSHTNKQKSPLQNERRSVEGLGT